MTGPDRFPPHGKRTVLTTRPLGRSGGGRGGRGGGGLRFLGFCTARRMPRGGFREVLH
jgi:hypothetical protein